MSSGRMITVKVSDETFANKKKALYIMSEEGTNLSRKVGELIDAYAKKFDEAKERE